MAYTYTYSDQARETEEHALPNVEVFCISQMDVNYNMTMEHWQENTLLEEHIHLLPQFFEVGWYWWACFPGGMPPGEPYGPFKTEAAAVADAFQSTVRLMESLIIRLKEVQL